jgi:hypothetical protein
MNRHRIERVSEQPTATDKPISGRNSDKRQRHDAESELRRKICSDSRRREHGQNYERGREERGELRADPKAERESCRTDMNRRRVGAFGCPEEQREAGERQRGRCEVHHRHGGLLGDHRRRSEGERAESGRCLPRTRCSCE